MSMRLLVPLAVAASCLASPASGQRPVSLPKLELSLLAGPSSYDLSGTGTTFAVGSEVAYVPVSALYLEAGITYFEYTTQFGSRNRFIFPEVSVQGALPLGPVSPYVGGGAGLSLLFSGGNRVDPTLHIVGGIRVRATPEWGARGELRIRAVDPFGAVTADFMFGVSRRF